MIQNGTTSLNFFTNPPSKELSIISEKGILELSSESKRFRKFSDLIKLNHPNISPQHSENIRAGIKLPIPPLTRLEDLNSLYQTAFILRKRKPKKCRNSAKRKEKWKMEQIIVFVWIVSEYSYIQEIPIERLKEEDWKNIASLLPANFTAEKCKYKWNSFQKSSLQKEEWSFEEDRLLKTLVKKNEMVFKNRKSYKWTKIAQELNTNYQGGMVRLGKHCRERWLNHLDPQINRDDWTFEEDLFLLERIREVGKKWAFISTLMSGRNENAVKNRFTSLLRYLGKLQPSLNFQNIEEIIICFREKFQELGAANKKFKGMRSKDMSIETNTETKSPNLDKIPLELIPSPTFRDQERRDKWFGNEGKKTIKFIEEAAKTRSPNCSPIMIGMNVTNSSEDFSSLVIDKKGLNGKKICFVDEKKDHSNNFHSLDSNSSMKLSLEELPNQILQKKEKNPNIEMMTPGGTRKSFDLLAFRKEISPTKFQRKENKKASWFSNQDSEKNNSKALLYDIALQCLPNIYSQKYLEEDLSRISEDKFKKELYMKMIQENFNNLDDLSQKISSMSLSDQLLVETNKILTEISSKISSDKGYFRDSIAGSDEAETHKSEEKKEMLLVSKVMDNEDTSQINFEDPLNRHLLRVRTNEVILNVISSIEESHEDHKLSPNLDSPRKKKSATVIQHGFVGVTEF